jgi:hypothetical protein
VLLLRGPNARKNSQLFETALLHSGREPWACVIVQSCEQSPNEIIRERQSLGV